jgi:membrane protein DedA with SNARE-associated domain
LAWPTKLRPHGHEKPRRAAVCTAAARARAAPPLVSVLAQGTGKLVTIIGALTAVINAAAAAPPPLQCGVIVAATFILEDAATLLSGMMAAGAVLSPELALSSLIAGIALGDLALYGLGRLAALNRYARWLAGQKPLHDARRWLGKEMLAAVWMTRFVPGTRLPAYSAFGFLGLPFGRFARSVIGAVLVWTTLLFFAGYFFGISAEKLLGPWCWLAGLAMAVLIFICSRMLRCLNLRNIGRTDCERCELADPSES